MQRIVIDEPYEFVPPSRQTLISALFKPWLPGIIRKRYGIVEYRYSGIEALKQSLADGDGIILCPNHSRDSDPMLMGMVCREARCHIYSMASWHVFKQNWLESTIARILGGFSVYREGNDRDALSTAVQIVADAERPLVLFPEGVISRSNDRLLGLMDGVSFIARTAAKQREKNGRGGQIKVLPLVLRYELLSTVEECVGETLDRLEQRTFWKTHPHLPIIDRIRQLARAQLAGREVEILGDSRSGPMRPRIESLMDAALHPHEERWLGGRKLGDKIQRVKDLRIAIVRELLNEKLSEEDRSEHWRALADCYYVQGMSLYPQDYLKDGVRGPVTPERIAETVHRLEEDMTDSITMHPQWRVHFMFGEPIPVQAGRRPRGEDPVLTNLRAQMLQLLGVEDWWPHEDVREATAEGGTETV